jgi:hypothetical protein
MTKRKSKGAYMLSRFAGVSEAGVRRRNPDPELAEGEGTYD